MEAVLGDILTVQHIHNVFGIMKQVAMKQQDCLLNQEAAVLQQVTLPPQ